MKTYNFKRRSFTSGPHLLGLMFTAAGLFSIASPIFIEISESLRKPILVGAGALAIGLMMMSAYGGTLIDFNRKRVKEYASFMGYKFGQWSVLPKILRITVISIARKETNTPNGISPTWSGTVTSYGVFLYAESSRAVLSFMFSNKQRAIAEAKHLSANLNASCELKIAEEIRS